MITSDVVLLGHLGDVCLMSQLSLANPEQVRLFTQPEYVQIARKYGAYVEVLPYDSLQHSADEVIDLHGSSCQIEAYKALVEDRGPLVWATSERLAWLGLEGQMIRRRDYARESLGDYWSRILGLKHSYEHYESATAPVARCIHGLSPCRTLVALQSSTRHKAPSPGLSQELLALVELLSSAGFTIAEGPGGATLPCDIPKGGRRAAVDTPEAFAALANQHCCMISVDSGLRHVASLVGLPRIVMYGPTDPAICGSGRGELAVRSSASCIACGDPHECRGNDLFQCLSTPNSILRGVETSWRTIHRDDSQQS